MVIGLTGKSCSGKNEVGLILEKQGLKVWDLDTMAHDGLLANLDAVIKAFGPDVVSFSNGMPEVSRKAIGKVVFSDPSMRSELEGILYPWLEKRIRSWKDSNPGGVLVINGALLHRAGFTRLCDCVIYVDAPYEARLSRAMQRDGITEETFRLREESQRDVDYSDVDYGVPVSVIVNDGLNFAELHRQVSDICDRLHVLRRQ